MLSESSYLTAMYAYIAAACAALLCMGWWLKGYWRPAWVGLVVLLGAALLLTPAFPNAEVQTLAPAILVAVFEGVLHGPEAARHAIKPLLAMSGLAVVLALLLGVTVLRRSPQPVAASDSEEPGS